MIKGQKLKKIANAVFEGGGVKGIGIAGALTVAEEHYDWAYVAGTSAGAIIASLVAAGYSSGEIADLVFNIKYSLFEDTTCLGNLPILGPFWRMRFHLGLYKGDYIENWIRDRLKDKGVQRFGDLVVRKNTRSPDERYRLRLIASDISSGRMLVLPQDIERYGIDPDYLDIARAVRMSISIPVFFEPVKLQYIDNDNNERTSYIIDGGVLSNYPVWLFDQCQMGGKVPTFGFKLMAPNEDRGHDIKGPVSLLSAVLGTMMEAHDIRYVEEKNFQRTVVIPTLDVRATDFNISRKKAEELFQSGVTAAEEFFGKWDYRTYLRKYGV